MKQLVYGNQQCPGVFLSISANMLRHAETCVASQDIRDKREEWKRAKEEMGKRVGEVESQLDLMEREKRRKKVVMMGPEIGTGEQKQIKRKADKMFRRESQSRE